MEALKATFRTPGVAQAAVGYYRCTLNPANQDPQLADMQMRVAMSPVAVPTLVLYGARDGCMSADLLDGMDALFPSGLRTVIVPDAGHFLHQERPEAVNR